jgi:hypothetical protein
MAAVLGSKDLDLCEGIGEAANDVSCDFPAIERCKPIKKILPREQLSRDLGVLGAWHFCIVHAVP